MLVLANRKASAVADRCEKALVLGCDSMLDLDGAALGQAALACRRHRYVAAAIGAPCHVVHRTLPDRHANNRHTISRVAGTSV